MRRFTSLLLLALSLIATGLSRADDFCVSSAAELQAALTAAEGNGEDDVIRIVQGTYHGNFVHSSPEPSTLLILGGYTAGCSSRILNPENTVLDGTGESGNILYLRDTSGASTLRAVDGLTLRNAVSGGGASFYRGQFAIVSNCILRGNKGGAGASEVVTFLFVNNTVEKNEGISDGGGLGLYNIQTATVTNNRFSANRADSDGGGLIAISAAQLVVSHNTFENNAVLDSPYIRGGAISILNSQSATIDANVIRGNSGGGIAVTYSDTVLIHRNTIYSNTVRGGVEAVTNYVITLANNLIWANEHSGTHTSGGGVFAERIDRLVLTNNTITGNLSTLAGAGGVHWRCNDAPDTLEMWNNVITGNRTDANERNLYLDNDSDLDGRGCDAVVRFNDFDQSANGAYIRLPFPIDASNLDNVDPLFIDPLSGNFRLGPGSPVVERGSSLAAELPALDRDGNPRSVGASPDIGAYEFRGAATVNLALADGSLMSDFTLASVEPVQWTAWILSKFGVRELWSTALPALPQPVPVSVPLAVPSGIGNIALITTVGTPLGKMVSYDFAVVDTGGSGPAPQELLERIHQGPLIPLTGR